MFQLRGNTHYNPKLPEHRTLHLSKGRFARRMTDLKKSC
jgi:hypothetical protein